MKKYVVLIVGLLILGVGGVVAFQKKSDDKIHLNDLPPTLASYPVRLEEKAIKVVEYLNQNEHMKAYEILSPSYRKTLTQKDFYGCFNTLNDLGPFQKAEVVKVSREQGLDCVFVNSFYQKGFVNFKLSFDENGYLSFLTYQPHKN
jgi:hypothetical protein